MSFLSKSLVFCERKSDSLVKKSKSLPSLFSHERSERITCGCSFVKSDRSYLRSLFCKEQGERFAEGRSFVKSDGSESLTVTLL